MTSPREIAERYWQLEAARDLDGVVRQYHSDATFRAPGWDLHGHDQIRTYYEDSARTYPHLEVDIVSEITVGDETALEWEAVLIDPSGGRHPLTGINRIRVKDGLLYVVHAYFDPAQLNT
jgi:ketosteroid isomerase-like protein